MDELETSMQILNFNARIKAITKVPVNVRNPNLGCLPGKHCPVQLYTRVAKIQQKGCDRDKSCHMTHVHGYAYGCQNTTLSFSL